MTPRGGKRPGAGRPKGSKTQKTPQQRAVAMAAAARLKAKGEEIAEKVTERMTPLELLTESMLALRDAAMACEQAKAVAVDAEDGEDGKPKVYSAVALRVLACEQAAKAAPYVHAKLASIEANVTGKVSLYETALLELAAQDVP